MILISTLLSIQRSGARRVKQLNAELLNIKVGAVLTPTNSILLGTREGIRTPDLWYRKPTLYPAELHARNVPSQLMLYL